MAAGLTKTQLVRHLAEKLETPNKTAAAFLEHLLTPPSRKPRRTACSSYLASAAW